MPDAKASATLFTDVAVEDVLSDLTRLADPDLVLEKLGLGRQELRKLETDDEISAALETRREAVVSTPWRLEPAEGEPVTWLWETLEPHVESLVRGLWAAVPYGYSVLEVVYRPEGQRVGLDRVAEKPLEWFEPRRDGTLWYTAPMGLGSGLPVQVDTALKFLLVRRNPTYRNPYGESLLSRLYWPWYFRHNGWRFWMRFLERFADPLLLGQVFDPSGFVEAMGSKGLESVVGVGKDESVSAVTQGGQGEFERVEMAIGRRIQKLILGQTLTSDVGDSGSYAAAQVHNQVRQDKRNADLRLVRAGVQQLVNALWRLNGFGGLPPSFVLADDTGLETARAERDAKLVQAGVLSLTDQYLLDRYDFAEGDFTVPATKPAVPPVPLSVAGPGATLSRQGPQRFSQDQELVEQLADAAIAGAASPIPVQAIRSAILAAETPEDLAERLAKLYAGQDAAQFREWQERALFAADVLGYVAAEKKIGTQ